MKNENHDKIAPGGPGIEPKWTSSAKSGIGKAINSASDVSFTLGHGTVNEVFFPREDIACIRDIKCIVTGKNGFISDEEFDCHHHIEWMEEGVPAFRMTNRCRKNQYELRKEIITDPIRSTLLQKITLLPGKNTDRQDLALYVLLTPHIRNQGAGNAGWKGYFKGVPMLFAERDGISLAMVSSTEILACSVGYTGFSDGLTELKKHGKLANEYSRAENGNISLLALPDISKEPEILIAVGFGSTPEEAGNNAWSSILDGFELASAKYIFEWQRWQRSLTNVKSDRNRLGRDFRKSAAVLRVHESLKFPGGVIASLSIPWGNSKGDGDLGGYHLVWPRDLALSSGGFLELHAKDDVLRILNYIITNQEADGHWSQNMWLEGVPFWKGIQMDEVALSVLLVHIAYQKGFVDERRCRRYWPVVRKALSYMVLNGPYTQQDRWEEESGFTAFTLATQIAALVAGAELAVANGEEDVAAYCLQTADYWNASIDKWLYVSNSRLSREAGVEGFYMRINPFDMYADDVSSHQVKLKNHADGDGYIAVGELVSVDALALVRFGLRDACDPRILNTVRVIDRVLKVDTPTGPCWHRYNEDGYGEDAAGNPYTGHGIGRAWPLLTGERAHYEIAAGNIGEARRLLKTMESFANNALLPEQIWDTSDIPDKKLYFGRPSGSAIPLTWAHAEYIKLCSSIKHHQVVDMPALTYERYVKQKTRSPYVVWRFMNQNTLLPAEKILRIETFHPVIVRWTDNDWQDVYESASTETGLGIFVTDLSRQHQNGREIKFTFFWTDSQSWEQENFTVELRQSIP